MAALLAAYLFGLASEEAVDLETLALGATTTSFYAQFEGHPIHCRDLRDVEDCLAGQRARGLEATALWLGNSQLHTINQITDDDATASALLAQDLRTRGVDLITFSQPNANLQEHLVLFSYLRARLPLSHLVLPLVCDDLRETGVRGDLAGTLNDPETVTALERHEIGREIIAHNQRDAPDGDIAALEGTIQEHSEAALNAWLEERWSAWRQRPDARGWLFSSLRRTRNNAFGITAQTKRKLIPARRALNFAAANALLEEARDANVKALVYVVPLRRDVAIPYDKDEYAQFKQDAAAMADAAGAHFVDLEGVVPSRYWGEKSATNLSGKNELDFMHFQGPGHVLLADALSRAFASMLPGPRP